MVGFSELIYLTDQVKESLKMENLTNTGNKIRRDKTTNQRLSPNSSNIQK
jgi:hypothetical protein